MVFSKKSSMSSVLMLALHAFLPFLELLEPFPISFSLSFSVLVSLGGVKVGFGVERGGRRCFEEEEDTRDRALDRT